MTPYLVLDYYKLHRLQMALALQRQSTTRPMTDRRGHNRRPRRPVFTAQ
jgi:hypothetical protein